MFFAWLLIATVTALPCAAQTAGGAFTRELTTAQEVNVKVENPSGRVSILADEDRAANVTVLAESPSGKTSLTEKEIIVTGGGTSVSVTVKPLNPRDRIDLTLNVPARARLNVKTDAGVVEILGNPAAAQVETVTGTIRADVPLEAVRYNWIWRNSRPRYFGEATIGETKEGRAGAFYIKGKLGDEKAKREESVVLEFTTDRGLVLLNVSPDEVPADLRERTFTDAAKAIIRNGSPEMVEAVRRVSPRLFGEYTRGLPPVRGGRPTLLARDNSPSNMAVSVAPQQMRLNVGVTDRNGRAIAGLTAADFAVFEGADERRIIQVEPTNAPFNLILLLDVSGSVTERIDFIRKAARDFLATASAQDRIAIIGFREDVQVISDFTSDRKLLYDRLNDLQAGGSTAYYDALAYALVEQLRPLRGERTGIVILSDGDDNRSFVPFPQILVATTESGALIYPLYIPSELVPENLAVNPQATVDPMRARYLSLTTRAENEGKQLAAVSGGMYYPITHLSQLQAAYDDVVAQLRTSYTITYETAPQRTTSARPRVHVKREGVAVRISPSVSVPQQTPLAQ